MTKSVPTQQKLADYAKHQLVSGIKQLFADNKNRASDYAFEVSDILFDLSKTHIDGQILDLYLELADSVEFNQRKLAFFAGEKINNTEQRAVLHPLLRSYKNYPCDELGEALLAEAIQSQQAFFDSCERCAKVLHQSNRKIENIIHIGIGGSSLGTQLIFEALSKENGEINLHFLANVEGHQLKHVLSKCRPETTLVIAVSKSFKTRETLTNVAAIKRWFEANGQLSSFRNSLYAVTAKKKNAIKHGVPLEQIIKFPTWVGGRFSVWSAVSFSAAILLGVDKFKEFLSGASEMDHHFYGSPLSENICFLTAAMDHFYVNYCDAQTRAVFSYDYRLRSLVDYLQQLETESNGKERCIDGEVSKQKTSPVVWGGVGTEVQHSVFQLLHQGTLLIPSEFILVAKAGHKYKKHHRTILANGLAQTAALLEGKSEQQVLDEYQGKEINIELLKSKVFYGNRPSTTILLEQVTPYSLGALLAFYEHRTFSFGALCQINSFDQMGVELGKQLAKQLMPRLKNKPGKNSFDPSTEHLLSRILKSQ